VKFAVGEKGLVARSVSHIVEISFRGSSGPGKYYRKFPPWRITCGSPSPYLRLSPARPGEIFLSSGPINQRGPFDTTVINNGSA